MTNTGNGIPDANHGLWLEGLRNCAHRAIVNLAFCLATALLCLAALCGCGPSGQAAGSSSSDSQAAADGSAAGDSGSSESVAASSEGEGADSSSSSSCTGGWSLVTDDIIDELRGYYDEVEDKVTDELEDRKNATPVHASLGEEVAVTDNLAVSVLSVEPGPYDYADDGPTVKVTVAMRNLTDKALFVKASNWDADNTSGQRIDHKLYVKDERGNRDTRSFGLTRVSPRATFTGVLYFDGAGLVSVVYEPHWLVSSENQYVYFDL